MPSPSPRISYFRNCAVVAPARRGNHTKGTAMVRPSTSDTMSSSSVNFTCCANGHTSTARVLIPGLQKFIFAFFDDPLYRPQFTGVEPFRTCQSNRSQPELCKEPLSLYMNMRRLSSFVTVSKTCTGHVSIWLAYPLDRGFGPLNTSAPFTALSFTRCLQHPIGGHLYGSARRQLFSDRLSSLVTLTLLFFCTPVLVVYIPKVA